MLFTSVKYAKLLSYKLERYKIKKDTGNTFMVNFRCPICGDSAASKKKARGYIYSNKDNLFMKCFNCGASMGFSKFLKTIDAGLYSQYAVEAFKESNDRIDYTFSDTAKVPLVKFDETDNEKLMKGATSVYKLSDDHPAKKYVLNRMIPENRMKEIFYTPKFLKWASKHTDKFKTLTNLDDLDHPRLIIPFYNEEGDIFKYHARAFGAEKPKYFSINIMDDPYDVYGLNHIDWNQPVYVVEGPIDSMFLPNAVAIGSSALNTFDKWGADLIYLYDQQPRNKEIVKLVNKSVQQGKKVVLMDENEFPWKDINDAIMAGETTESLTYLFGKHTYQGLAAKMVFNTWRKV